MNQSLRKFWVEETVSKKSSELQTAVIAECPVVLCQKYQRMFRDLESFQTGQTVFLKSQLKMKKRRVADFELRKIKFPSSPSQGKKSASLYLSLSLSFSRWLSNPCSHLLSDSLSQLLSHVHSPTRTWSPSLTLRFECVCSASYIHLPAHGWVRVWFNISGWMKF